MTAARPKRYTDQIAVRLDDDLRAQLQADAEANERTVAQSIRLILRRHFAALVAAVALVTLSGCYVCDGDPLPMQPAVVKCDKLGGGLHDCRPIR